MSNVYCLPGQAGGPPGGARYGKHRRQRDNPLAKKTCDNILEAVGHNTPMMRISRITRASSTRR
jgi:hypothetical protein